LALLSLSLVEGGRGSRGKRSSKVRGSRSTTYQAPPDEPRDVTPEEVQEITDDLKETEKVEHTTTKETGDEWVKEWETVMGDFSADIMFRTEIDPKSDEVRITSLIHLGLLSYCQRKRKDKH
jgi:hypothetical protein